MSCAYTQEGPGGGHCQCRGSDEQDAGCVHRQHGGQNGWRREQGAKEWKMTLGGVGSFGSL